MVNYFVIALLGCSWPPYKTRKWSDAGILFSYGLKNYNKTDLYKHLGKTEPVPVKVKAASEGRGRKKSFVLAKRKEIELSPNRAFCPDKEVRKPERK